MARRLVVIASLVGFACTPAPRAAPDPRAIADQALLPLVELAGELGTEPEPQIAALRAVQAAAERAAARRTSIAARSLLASRLAEAGGIGEAVPLLTAILDELRAAPDVEAEALAEERLGMAFYFSGDGDKALQHLGRALELSRAHHLAGREATTLRAIGLVYLWVVLDPARALIYETAALLACQRVGDVLLALDTRVPLAGAQRRLGDPKAALATHVAALEAARAGVARGAPGRFERRLLTVLLDLAPTYTVLGRYPESRATSDEAAALARKLGEERGLSLARFSFAEAAMKEKRWDEAEAALGEVIAYATAQEAAVSDEKLRLPRTAAVRNLTGMLLDILVGRGDVERAFQASERLRARRLLAALGTDEIVDVAAARRLLADDTTLVEYAITSRNAYAFVVDAAHGVTLVPLGTAAQVTRAARAWYDLVSASGAPPADVAAASRTLADTIVTPLEPHLRGRRLAFVPDRALHYVAFGALPLPGGARLLERHEIVHLPSASVLAALRGRRAARRAVPTREIAVLADPIFDRGDARAGGAPPPAATVASLRDADAPADLTRLVSSHAEAEAIARLVPEGRRFVAEGRAATRAAALGPEVAGARLVHFATHAVLDNADPDRSGLVFTRIDAAGRAVDGTLRVPDIERARFAAEVVVLSACRTAIGKQFDGEGLVGLTRAFFVAGVPRVVSSLWQVDDTATAALMARFYRGLLGEKLAPAAALRRAQREVGGQNPRLWAAFSFHGDWL